MPYTHFKQIQHRAVHRGKFSFTPRTLYLPERIALVTHIVGQWLGLLAKTWNLVNQRHKLIIFQNKIGRDFEFPTSKRYKSGVRYTV